jgi:hypothetical protein
MDRFGEDGPVFRLVFSKPMDKDASIRRLNHKRTNRFPTLTKGKPRAVPDQVWPPGDSSAPLLLRSPFWHGEGEGSLVLTHVCLSPRFSRFLSLLC